MTRVRDELSARVSALIERLRDGAQDDAARDALLGDVLRFQREVLPPYARIVQRWRADADDPLRWPAVPTDVFRHTRVAAHPASEDVRVFRTSGTTAESRGAHHLRDLSLYDQSARVAARYALFPDHDRMPLVILAPRPLELGDSSLSYMLERFAEWFGSENTAWLWNAGQLDVERLAHELSTAERLGRPLALLGTSFAFVHAEDALDTRRFALPRGSRVMQTGGFKGRTRTVEPATMLELLSARYGIDPRFIVQEYGMTELCSQLYETTLRDAALGRGSVVGTAPALRGGASGTAPALRGGALPRRLWVPGWVRATVVDALTLAALPHGQEGLLRIDDPCNLDTACAIQTSDRALCVDGGILVLGRADNAALRGCSIAADAALGG